jgi:serine/threonine protein kinase
MSDRDDVTRSLPADATTAYDPAATRTVEPASPAAPPDLPPNYTLVGEIGRGAMGVVYRARQVLLNREVALKLILSGRHASPTQLARFLAEVQAAAAVDHPHVVRVYDSGEHAGTPFLAMEYVGGGTLSAKLASGPIPPREAAELVAKVCDGVQAAHAAGIVHRDLKPGNILLAADGTPKVADFGLAKRPGGTDLTHTGAILGTPGYMAPEQARGQGKAVGPPADVYALGAVLFHCLAGRPPFVGDDPVDVILRAATDDPPSVTRFNRSVARDLATVCDKCLRKEPAARYAAAGELAADLRRFLTGEPIQARRAGRFGRRFVVAGMVGTAFLLTGVGWLLFGPAGPTPTTRNSPSGLESSAKISGDPLDLAVRFLSDAQLNPTNSAALKWASPGFQFDWSAEADPRTGDRPYYQYAHATIDEHQIVDNSTIEYRGTVTVLERVTAVGGGRHTLPSGGRAAYTLTVRANRQAGAWRVDSFVFADRGCRAGPALLPQEENRAVVRDTLNYPPEAFAKNTPAEVEAMIGLKSWVLFYCGGPVDFRLALEETGQETILPANLITARGPYPGRGQEGRVCLQIGRDFGRESLAPRDYVYLGLNRNFGYSHALPCLWYHWKGAKVTDDASTPDLGDGLEHEVLKVTAEEEQPPEGKEPRKVVLRVLAKKATR